MSDKKITAGHLSKDYEEFWMGMSHRLETGARVYTACNDGGPKFFVVWDDGLKSYIDQFVFLHEVHDFLKAKNFDLFTAMGV